jgi:hypothetical protein
VTDADLFSALRPVAAAFESLGVRYFVGGSVASSAHGLARASLDVDVVADLDPPHVSPLVRRLEDAYYVDEDRVRAAVEARRSFNVIHLETMFKVDVFVSKRRPYDQEALARAQVLEERTADVRTFVASAEDTVLAKLEWFRAGGEVSERQWADVIGVLKTARHERDEVYMRRWAADLGVADLLERALAESTG